MVLGRKQTNESIERNLVSYTSLRFTYDCSRSAQKTTSELADCQNRTARSFHLVVPFPSLSLSLSLSLFRFGELSTAKLRMNLRLIGLNERVWVTTTNCSNLETSSKRLSEFSHLEFILLSSLLLSTTPQPIERNLIIPDFTTSIQIDPAFPRPIEIFFVLSNFINHFVFDHDTNGSVNMARLEPFECKLLDRVEGSVPVWRAGVEGREEGNDVDFRGEECEAISERSVCKDLEVGNQEER